MVDLEELKYGDRIIHGSERLKRGFASMQKGGVVMDVIDASQAGIAEDAGAVAVMALERVPADIRAHGGVARMADPTKVQEILDAVSIPVMAKCRIGHVEEAKALQSMGVDMVDESEVLTPADPFFHVDKRDYTMPFVCGCTYLGEAIRRIWEGAAMIRTKGEAGTGNVIEAVRHMRIVNRSIAEIMEADDDRLRDVAWHFAQKYKRLLESIKDQLGLAEAIEDAEIVFSKYTVSDITEGLYEELKVVAEKGRLPVVNFAAGGIATPADAALMMTMGSDGVFVGSGIFKSKNPEERAKAIVQATTHYDDPEVVVEVSKGLGEAMKGLDIASIPPEERLQERGW